MVVANNKVFDFFVELTKIPHCSGQEKQISDYLVQFAKDRNLEVIQDEANNVIIKKPGSAGYEDHDPVILQGHMDMVCVKTDELEFDFDTMPLPIHIEGDWLKTKGTTLGADNGIAVAMAMAILDDNTLKHPPLEVLITTDEEVGLLGAAAVKGEYFKGRTLINMDSEEEGIYLTGCAGGARNIIELPVKFEENTFDRAFKVRVHGLAGGHSGIEINKNRANANKLIGRLLNSLGMIRLVSLSGGEKMNAIAKQAFATFVTNGDISLKVQEMEKVFQNEYASSDPSIKIDFEAVEKPEFMMEKESSKKALALLIIIPHGVQAMSQFIPELVETSTNLGVVETDGNVIKFESAHRSSLESKKQALIKKFAMLAELFEARPVVQGDYPGWEYKPESKIRDLFVKKYEEITGKKAETTAIHAGVECGILQRNIGELDMISFGPNMHDVHTPFERLSVSSTKKTYELLLGVLEEL